MSSAQIQPEADERIPEDLKGHEKAACTLAGVEADDLEARCTLWQALNTWDYSLTIDINKAYEIECVERLQLLRQIKNFLKKLEDGGKYSSYIYDRLADGNGKKKVEECIATYKKEGFAFNKWNRLNNDASKIRNIISINQEFLGGHVSSDGKWYFSQNTQPAPPPMPHEDESMPTSDVPKFPKPISLNTILYGPPGTGKTYSTVQYAVAIIEDKPLDAIQAESYVDVLARYRKYKTDGLVAFTTFHQSFGYEEFIEGIRPVLASDDGLENGRAIEYEVRDGIFKTFCDKAGTPLSCGRGNLGIGKTPNVWKVSLEKTGDNPTRTECLENNHIRIGYGEFIADDNDYSKSDGRGKRVLNAFYNGMQIGDIVMSCYSSRTIDAIGVITGEPEWNNKYQKYKRLRKVKWLIKYINEDIVDLNDGKILTLSTIYQLSISISDVMQILKKTDPQLFEQAGKIANRVFIIDEINRGNISKIFGELITLIEPAKRLEKTEELRTKLPYSGKDFGVPENVYIIGTMNTADRSLALLDTALRRRFVFEHVEPNAKLLGGRVIDGINLELLLTTMNNRIALLYDKEHRIGHSYFLDIKDIEGLAQAFENKIIPLLEEYFFEDQEKVNHVLGGVPFFKKGPADLYLQKMYNEDKLSQLPELWALDKEALQEPKNYTLIYTS